MLKDLITRNRSFRRFHQDVRVEQEILKEWIDLARLSASGANLQPLKYILSCESGKNSLIFPYLAWAGYLEDWPGPEEGERPSAYIVVLGDTTIAKSFGYDAGIAAQSIMLGAAERDFGGCIIGSIQREGLRAALSIPVHLEILLVLALGKPKEEVRIETVGADGSIRYWRGADGVHHVPKRPLAEILLS